jgi:acetyl esterase/lipase
VFVADQYCPDVEHCDPDHRTKAAWYPDNIEDVAMALQWTLAHIDAYSGDSGQIVIFGHSAGGHLVSLLATHEDNAALRPKIRGVVSLSGAYDLNSLNHFFWDSIVNQTFSGGFSNKDLLTDGSPSAWLTPTLNPPPFYLLYCQLDAPSLPEQANAFHDDLDALGFANDLSYLAGYDHVSEMAAIADSEAKPTRLIIAWIEKTLGPRVFLPLTLY